MLKIPDDQILGKEEAWVRLILTNYEIDNSTTLILQLQKHSLENANAVLGITHLQVDKAGSLKPMFIIQNTQQFPLFSSVHLESMVKLLYCVSPFSTQ